MIAIPTRKDVIPIEIEATIDVAMQTNAQTDLKARGRTASATAALSLPGQIQIPQWSFRRDLTRRGAGERTILRRRRWRGFCRLCLGSVVLVGTLLSHCLPHCFHSCFSHYSPIGYPIASPIGFLFNLFFFLFTFLTTPHDTKRRH
jgi:hypothetical protein